MNLLVIKKIQKVLISISLNSIGKSVPISMFEREIPKEVITLLKQQNALYVEK